MFRIIEKFIIILPFFHFIRGTKNIDPKITLGLWFRQKVLRFNSEAYWPMHFSSIVTYPKNVLIGKDTNPGYNPGCFIHGVNKIFIGNYTKMGPNVGLMSGNHNVHDLREQTESGPIIIGEYCWLGMNSMVMPGVELGPHTVVAANCVVTKSFADGYQVLAGVPARVIKILDREKCVDYVSDTTYIGYIHEKEFEFFRANNLNI